MKRDRETISFIPAMKGAISNETRLEAVRATGMLDQPSHAVFDELIARASATLKAPLTMITLVDEYRDYLVAQLGLPEPMAVKGEITDAPSFCQLTVTQDEPLAITDAQAMPIFQIFPSVSTAGVRAHLGIPLRFRGQPVGNCCVIDFQPRVWTQDEINVLTGLAEDVMRHIEAIAVKSERNQVVDIG